MSLLARGKLFSVHFKITTIGSIFPSFQEQKTTVQTDLLDSVLACISDGNISNSSHTSVAF